MIAPWLVVLIFFAIVFSILGIGELDKKITIEDINVGDKIKIKGEEFTVKGYGENGIMEVVNEKRETILIKFDKDVKLTSVNTEGVRLYIEVENFKGTVGGQYLNNIKL